MSQGKHAVQKRLKGCTCSSTEACRFTDCEYCCQKGHSAKSGKPQPALFCEADAEKHLILLVVQVPGVNPQGGIGKAKGAADDAGRKVCSILLP